jgi:hypothetical protein
MPGSRAFGGQDNDHELWLILLNTSLYLLIRNGDKFRVPGGHYVSRAGRGKAAPHNAENAITVAGYERVESPTV